MAQTLATGPKRFDEIVDLISGESQSIKDYIRDTVQQLGNHSAYTDYVNQYLESLRFPEIQSRQETIKKEHEKTFQWIFEAGQGRKQNQRWTDFVQWLKDGQGIYWVDGKAGSGKSTLMSFIYQDDRTNHLLKAWAGNKELFIPAFFFWNAGKYMQKSREGLLRSLLYQVLAQSPHKIPVPDQAVSDLGVLERHRYGPLPAWTEARLQKTLCDVMRQSQEECRFCIFIDGLDEIAEDPCDLIATIKNLQSLDAKICVSSRPEPPFIKAFSCGARLQLQMLTGSDITKFVTDKLAEVTPKIPLKVATELSIDVVRKAEGVFVWVHFVVKDLLKGLDNNDSADEMRKRIKRMPSDIRDLYAHMLSRIDDVYRSDASQLFLMALYGLTGSLLDVSLVLNDTFDQSSNFTLEALVKLCERTSARLPAMSAGLLELHTEVPLNPYGTHFIFHRSFLAIPDCCDITTVLAKASLYERTQSIDLFHKTFVEYLREDLRGRCFLEEHSLPSRNPYSSYVKALLTKMRILAVPTLLADIHVNMSASPLDVKRNIEDFDEGRRSFNTELRLSRECLDKGFVVEVMDKLSLAEAYAGTVQLSLCENVDRTVALLHQRQSCQPENFHWSGAWGYPETDTRDIDQRRRWLVSATTSRSSSPNSWHSAVSGHDHFYETLIPPSTEPCDFLGIACCWGLSYYARHTLDVEGIRINAQTATYLLCCSLRTFKNVHMIPHSGHVSIRVETRWWGTLRLLGELLLLGANPNVYVPAFSATVWVSFLQELPRYLSVDPIFCPELVKLFVEKGASLFDPVFRNRGHQTDGLPSFGEPPVMDFFSGKKQLFTTLHEMTTLYVFQERLMDTPQIKYLERECLLRDVSSSSRCRNVQVVGYNNSHLYSGEKPFKISQSQYSEFTKAINLPDRLLQLLNPTITYQLW